MALSAQKTIFYQWAGKYYHSDFKKQVSMIKKSGSNIKPFNTSDNEH